MESIEAASTIERILIEQAKQGHTPITGSLELLPLCNMNCDMCYVRLSPEEMRQKGRLRTADEWLEVGRQMADSGVLFLLLTGGEPLLFPDFKRLYLELRQMGLILTINTNGTLLDESWADFFGKYKPRRINITLYGADRAAYGQLCHYPEGFERVIRAVSLLRMRHVDVKLSTSVTKVNAADLERMIQMSRDLDVPFRADTYMLPAVRERSKPFQEQSRLAPKEAAKARIFALRHEMGQEVFEQYFHQIKQQMQESESGETEPNEAEPRNMDCLAGSCSFSVNWQGALHPCVILTEPSADVFEVGFAAAWQTVQDELQAIRLNVKCTHCKFRPLCRTCAACALLETGHYDGLPEYMCQYAEESWHCLKES